MAVLQFMAAGFPCAKQKTPPPLGSGVGKILVKESEPDCHAAQQQRIQQQQSRLQIATHFPIHKRFETGGQWDFLRRRLRLGRQDWLWLWAWKQNFWLNLP
jgi:hypothetical protein